MTIKHTPGPWKARDYKNVGGDIWIDCKAYKGETPLGGTLAIALHNGCGKGEMEANARLIAAAPELLACLRAVDAHWQTPIVPQWVADIRALLARLDAATPAE